jgi:hypothetical protein
VQTLIDNKQQFPLSHQSMGLSDGLRGVTGKQSCFSKRMGKCRWWREFDGRVCDGTRFKAGSEDLWFSAWLCEMCLVRVLVMAVSLREGGRIMNVLSVSGHPAGCWDQFGSCSWLLLSGKTSSRC